MVLKTNFNILSLNISLAPFLWRPYARIRTFARQNEVKNADIIILQEVYTYDMLLYLRYRLEGFTYTSYKPGLIGPKAGLVTFSRRPLHTEGFMTLSARKGILISKLGGVTIVNVHLMAHTDGDWSARSSFYLPHKEQLDQLNKRLHHKEQKIILSGDFNLAKTSDLYRYFVAEGSWQDTAGKDGMPTFHREFLPQDRSPQRIDYIFVRGGINVVSNARVFEDKVDGMFLSNHMSLVARVETLK